VPRKTRIAVFTLVAALAACRRDNVRALDSVPEVPESIDFGLLPVNQQKVVPLTISNSGKIGLQVTDLAVREPFDVELPPEAVLPGGSSDVLVKFEPTQPGEVNERLTLQTSSAEMPVVTVRLHGIAFDPQLGVSPDRLDFGDVNVGDHKALTFQITNRAPIALNPSVRPLDPASDFSVSPQGFLGSLQTGDSATVTVVFTPSVSGPAASGVVLECPVCGARQVQLTGNGIGAVSPGTDGGSPQPDAGVGPPTSCTLQAQPARVDFGKVKPGASARQVVTLSSTGTGSCVLQTPYFASGSDPSLSAAPLAAGELQPSQSTTFTVVYAPADKTPTQVAGKVVVVSSDKDHSPLEIPLTGELDPPPPPPPPPSPGKLVVAPPSLSFTAQAPNAPAAQTLSLLNDGGSKLSWTATSSDAKVTISSASGSLAPGASSTVSISVAADTAAGSRTATIVFDAADAGKVSVPVQIIFTAAPPPPPPPGALDVKPLSLFFTAQAPAAPPSQSITVSNLGGQPLSWTGSVDDSGVSFDPRSGSLVGGAAQVVKVSVAAAPFAGKRSATLTVDAAAAGKKSVAISIEFTQPPPPPPPPQYGGSAWPKWHHDNASSGLSHVDTSSNGGAVFWKSKISPPVPCINDERTGHNIRCGTYVNSPVLAEDGSVIQLGGDGFLYELDRATGKQLWKVETAAPWIAANEGTPTVVKDGSIFLMTAGENHSKPQFYKLSKDGQVAHKLESGGGGNCNGLLCDGWDSSPALGDDGTLYEANDDYGTIQLFDQRGQMLREVALDPKSDIETQSGALSADNVGYWSANGHLWAVSPTKQLWSFTDDIAAKVNDWRPHATFHNIKSSPALTPDGKVIFTYVYETTRNGATLQTTRIYAFQAGAAQKQLWVASLGPTKPKTGLPPGPGVASDYADSTHYRSGITSPAVGPDGTIYVGHCDGLFAVDPKSGKFKWGVGMAEVVSSPAVGKDGTIYVGSMDGNLYAITPAGSVKWQVKTGGQLNSSPAIGADGTVYAMSDDGYLYAVH
jgi:outer membrane protein assembly factor BamB